MGRRNDVVNEALAEEVRRAEQRKRRDADTAVTMRESQSAAHAARDPRENLVELDPDPKRSLHMKSAPSADSNSGQ